MLNVLIAMMRIGQNAGNQSMHIVHLEAAIRWENLSSFLMELKQLGLVTVWS